MWRTLTPARMPDHHGMERLTSGPARRAGIELQMQQLQQMQQKLQQSLQMQQQLQQQVRGLAAQRGRGDPRPPAPASKTTRPTSATTSALAPTILSPREQHALAAAGNIPSASSGPGVRAPQWACAT